MQIIFHILRKSKKTLIFSQYLTPVPFSYVQQLFHHQFIRSFIHYILRMKSSGEHSSQDEIKRKLVVILHSLQKEEAELREMYHRKICELYEEIDEKQTMINVLEEKLEKSEKKCNHLEWKLIEKDEGMERLGRKVLKLQQKIKENIQPQKQKSRINQKKEMTQQKQNSQIVFEDESKVINISEYFIKAVEASKNSTNIDSYENSYNTTVSHKNFNHLERSDSVFSKIKSCAKLGEFESMKKIYCGRNHVAKDERIEVKNFTCKKQDRAPEIGVSRKKVVEFQDYTKRDHKYLSYFD